MIPLILQLDVSGNPHKWITFDHAVYYQVKNLVAWTVGSNEFRIVGGTNALTGQLSEVVINSIMSIKGDKDSMRPIPLTNKSLFRRDGLICCYCGNSYGFDKLTREHITPTSKGGKDTWVNTITACGPCNRYKGDKTVEQAGMKLLYRPYIPSRAEYLIHANSNILSDQYDFLMLKIPTHSRLHPSYTN